MFVENYNKIEGRLTYKSKWIEPLILECKTIIFIKDKKTKAIIFHKYDPDGASPSVHFEALATILYHERLSKTNIKDIEWYLVHQEAIRATAIGTLIETWPVVHKAMFRMKMDWVDGEFKNGQSIILSEDEMRLLIEKIDAPSTSSDLFWRE